MWSADGKKWKCLAPECEGAAEMSAHSIRGMKNILKHFRRVHPWLLQKAELKKLIAELHALEKAAADSKAAAMTASTGSRIAETRLKEIMVTVTARFKQPESWIDGPVKALVSELNPELKMFGRDTLGRAILERAKQLLWSLNETLLRVWNAPVRKLPPLSSLPALAQSASADDAADVVEEESEEESAVRFNLTMTRPSAQCDGWTARNGDKYVLYLATGANASTLDVETQMLGASTIPGVNSAEARLTKLKLKSVSASTPLPLLMPRRLHRRRLQPRQPPTHQASGLSTPSSLSASRWPPTPPQSRKLPRSRRSCWRSWSSSTTRRRAPSSSTLPWRAFPALRMRASSRRRCSLVGSLRRSSSCCCPRGRRYWSSRSSRRFPLQWAPQR